MSPWPILCMWCNSTPPNHEKCYGEHARHMGRHGWVILACTCDCRTQLVLDA